MRSSGETVLAIGAGGRAAGLVVPELVRRGARVRGFVHKPEEQPVRQAGAAEVLVGDLTDADGLKAAMQGAWGVFYLAPAFMPDEAEVGRRVVQLAQAVGVRRFVFSSVIHPVLSELENHIAKAPVEEAIIDSDMEYALLQPGGLFMQNLAGSFAQVLQSGTYAEPWSAETRFSRVDYRDVAEVAAIALTENRLNYGTYQLCAEGWLNRHEVASLMGEVLGRHIQAGTMDPKQLGGSPSDGMHRMFAWYDHHGLLGNALTLRAILGREPRTLRAYLEELAAQAQQAT